MKVISVRLTDGMDLYDEIQTRCQTQQVEAGVILSGVGSLTTSNIRVPVLSGKVTYIHPQNLEIDSVQGTVSRYGCHLHITVSDINGTVYGGHLKSGCIIRTTCELVIGVIDAVSFTREQDPDTGFDELVVVERSASS